MTYILFGPNRWTCEAEAARRRLATYTYLVVEAGTVQQARRKAMPHVAPSVTFIAVF